MDFNFLSIIIGILIGILFVLWVVINVGFFEIYIVVIFNFIDVEVLVDFFIFIIFFGKM